MRASGYGAAVRQLQQSSRGLYTGPRIGEEVLNEALAATEGLDPSALLGQTRQAVGSSDASTMRLGILPEIAKLLFQVAAGAIANKLGDKIEEWWSNRQQSSELSDSAEQASDALTDIQKTSDLSVSEILSALTAVITQLSAFLSRIDPSTYPREFSECVSAGSELIDAAGATVLEQCRDRDKAVCQCFDEFLARCEPVCDKPASGPAHRDVATCDDVSTAPATSSGGGGGGGGGGTSSALPAAAPPAPPTAPPTAPPPAPETPTQPQSVAPPTESTPPPPPTPPSIPPETPPPAPPTVPPIEPPPTAPQSVEECPPAETHECEPPEEEDNGDDFTGILGLIGIGIVALCLEAIIDCLREPALPEPPAVPEPEPEPEPEPAPEPPPPPKQNLPTDLAAVPEPPPPPKQNIQVEEPVAGGARKAGQW